MHPLLVFLYCCAANMQSPAGVDDWVECMRTAIIVMPHIPPMAYDQDPLVMVSLFHHHVDASFNLDAVVSRFTTRDVGASTWGPAAWEVAHALAAGPDFSYLPHLLESWTRLLPCPDCRRHLTAHVAASPFAGTTAEDATRYMVALHNAVNVSLGKPVYWAGSA